MENFAGIENAFKYLDTHGLPLIMHMDFCEKKGFRTALDHFVADAVKAGWKFEKAMSVVQEALQEKYGPKLGQERAAILESGIRANYRRYFPMPEPEKELDKQDKE